MANFSHFRTYRLVVFHILARRQPLGPFRGACSRRRGPRGPRGRGPPRRRSRQRRREASPPPSPTSLAATGGVARRCQACSPAAATLPPRHNIRVHRLHRLLHRAPGRGFVYCRGSGGGGGRRAGAAECLAETRFSGSTHDEEAAFWVDENFSGRRVWRFVAFGGLPGRAGAARAARAEKRGAGALRSTAAATVRGHGWAGRRGGGQSIDSRGISAPAGRPGRESEEGLSPHRRCPWSWCSNILVMNATPGREEEPR